MSVTTPKLHRRPEARAVPVEDLVDRVLRGQVRIPEFQRPLRWSNADVRALLDSLWRGYPVGSLLMWKRRAEAVDGLRLGPLVLPAAPASDEAWWVVDGQQRLVSLAASLGRLEHAPADETYDVWFDTEHERFVGRDHGRTVPTAWVPLRIVLDASRLQDWLYEWPLGRDAERRRTVLDVGHRLRSYQIPVYIIDVDDDAVLREVFRRTNRSGHPLTEPEVFDALYGTPSTGSTGIARLSELSDRLAEEGWGRPPTSSLLHSVLAMAGKDVTRRLDQLDLEGADLTHLLEGAREPILQTIRFLRDEAEIPHIRLLPYATPLVVLPAFFHKFPDPSSRVRINLVRWAWRGFLRGGFAESPVRRAHVAVVANARHAEEGAMNMLGAVGGEAPEPWTVPDRFDGRDARTRIAVLGLVTLAPRRLDDESRIDVRALLAEHGEGAYRTLLRGGRWAGVGHRLLHPPLPSLRRLLRERIEAPDATDDVLASHGIPAGFRSMSEPELFVERERAIERAVRRLADRLAAWGRGDRPSIAYLDSGGDE